MRPANNQQLFNDDGTPRRKYEIDESPSNIYLLRASIGFVLANAFILAKNIMFGAEPASKQQQMSLNAAANEPSEHAGEPNAAGLEEEETYGDGLASSQLDSGTIRLLTNAGTASRVFGEQGAVRSTTSGTTFDQAYGNDNVALYGAAPGRPIGIFAGSDSVSLPGQGGGGSGGGSSGGSTGNGGGNPGDSGSGDNGGGDEGDDEPDPGPSTRVNRLPVIAAPLILPSLLSNQSVVIALSELLSNVSDPDGDQLSVRNLSSSSGTLQTRSDGSWNFTPEHDDTSDVTFTYNVSDGMGGVVQTTALLDLVPTDTTITGTDGADIIVGTPYADVIDALCGDDIVLGREGDDVIFGGDGNDRIVAGDGNDVVYAGAGDDVVFSGGGGDIVFGGTGNDLLFGDDGNDVLLGEAGRDTIWGGIGADNISGGDGDDHLYGEAGEDFLDGGAGNNYLDGGAGNDTILVHVGDVAKGDTGDDTLIAVPHSSAAPVFVADPGPTQFGSGEVPDDETDNTLTTVATSSVEVRAEATAGTANTETSSSSQNVANALAAAAVAPAGPQDNQSSTEVDGGDGIDTLDVQAVSADMKVNLKAGAAFSTATGYIEIANVEDVTGGSGYNTIVGSDVDNNLTGGASDDIILGEAGDDYIAGGDNVDLLAGGKDADTVLGGDGDDVIAATIDDGNDHYAGGSGSDTYDATTTSADLTVDLDAGVASSSETGEDTLTGIENVNCGSGNDTIVANDEVNTFTGGEGADTFVFGSVAAIGMGSGSRDKILDFAVGDRIDLDKISDDFVDDLQDAFGDHVIRRFVLIGAQETFSQAGQMKVRYEDTNDGQVTILSGNINGDADAEFELELMGHIEFRDDDFIPRY